MLRLLRIRNFAIIESLELEFEGGFNAITGETGAGKSIILDAIGLILGNRANAEVIRTGSDEATVEALFDIGSNEANLKRLADFGLSAAEELLVKRTVHRNGKNKIYINGELITLAQLGDICENLVELCSQHEHQSLSKPAFQMDLLDRYGGLADKRREVREVYSAYKSAENELAVLTGSEDGKQSMTEDFLKFQLSELDEFGAKPGEEEELQNDRRRLMNVSNLLEGANQACSYLDGGEGDVRTLIGKSIMRLRKLTDTDSGLEPAATALERAQVEIEEAVGQLSSYAQALDADPSRLEEVEERIQKWSAMKKKYGADAEAILATRERIAAQIDGFAHRQERIDACQERIDALKAEFMKSATELSKKRKNVAKTLCKTIEEELAELSMPNTTFKVEFSVLDAPSAEGIDRAQFVFSPNPGEEAKPISKIASGGELSRVLLAVRRTIADRGGIGVYLFDEVDSGIGGATASVVGKKIASVAKYNQIICITHLPQVASFANAHFHVTKKVASGRTQSEITRLDGTKRIDEIARMLGGTKLTDKSRGHARDLLKEATV